MEKITILRIKAFTHFDGNKKLYREFIITPNTDNLIELVNYAEINAYTLDISLEYVEMDFKAEID